MLVVNSFYLMVELHSDSILSEIHIPVCIKF